MLILKRQTVNEVIKSLWIIMSRGLREKYQVKENQLKNQTIF
jgi:hypothetical protein